MYLAITLLTQQHRKVLTLIVQVFSGNGSGESVTPTQEEPVNEQH